MRDFYFDRLYWVRKGAIPDEELGRYCEEMLLTERLSETYAFGGKTEQPETICLYEDARDYIGFPRWWGLRKWGKTEDRTVTGKPVTFSFKGQLGSRPEWVGQQECVDDVCKQLPDLYGGIIAARGGWGKTIIGCALIARLGVTTLVLVHKDFLEQQWRDRIKDTLGNVPVGLVKQSVCDYQNKPIVLAYVESLAARVYPLEFYNAFGLVISDECHRLGAPVWQRAQKQFPARYRIGLSATVRRSDGFDVVFRYQIGPILFESDKTVAGDFFVVRMPIEVHEQIIERRWFLKSREKWNKARIETDISQSPRRNEWLALQLVRAAKAGRKVLALSSRINQLEVLKQMVDAQLRNGHKSGFYHGQVDKAERDKNASDCVILLGTLQFAKEALDLPSFDTLVLCTPASDVEQALYRIARAYDGKKRPLVVDVVDSHPILQKMADVRLGIYERLGLKQLKGK